MKVLNVFSYSRCSNFLDVTKIVILFHCPKSNTSFRVLHYITNCDIRDWNKPTQFDGFLFIAEIRGQK